MVTGWPFQLGRGLLMCQPSHGDKLIPSARNKAFDVATGTRRNRALTSDERMINEFFLCM
jgi:hypothetical protein